MVNILLCSFILLCIFFGLLQETCSWEKKQSTKQPSSLRDISEVRFPYLCTECRFLNKDILFCVTKLYSMLAIRKTFRFTKFTFGSCLGLSTRLQHASCRVHHLPRGVEVAGGQEFRTSQSNLL